MDNDRYSKMEIDLRMTTMARVYAWLFTFALVAITATGCISAQKQSMAEDVLISGIRVDPEVKLPDEMYYVGPGLGAGMMFGAIGAAAASSGNETDSDVIRRFAADNGVDISAIVRDAFERGLRKEGSYPYDEKAETVLSIEILRYGLSIPHGFSRNLVPILLVQARITDEKDTILWQGGDSVLPLGGPADSVKLAEIMADPSVLEALWRAAADRTAEETLKQLDQ